jgi:hypothetical protein
VLHDLPGSLVLQVQPILFIFRKSVQRQLLPSLLVSAVEVLTYTEEKPGTEDEHDIYGVASRPSRSCTAELV